MLQRPEPCAGSGAWAPVEIQGMHAAGDDVLGTLSGSGAYEGGKHAPPLRLPASAAKGGPGPPAHFSPRLWQVAAYYYSNEPQTPRSRVVMTRLEANAQQSAAETANVERRQVPVAFEGPESLKRTPTSRHTLMGLLKATPGAPVGVCRACANRRQRHFILLLACSYRHSLFVMIKTARNRRIC